MTTSTAIPTTIQIRRSRLLGLLAAVAILTAAITWALSAFALDDGSSSTRRTSVLTGTPISTTSAAQDAARVPSIMALTPARLAAGALGTGYALPTAHLGPTLASVLASMGPETRRYTKAVTSLTFTQLAAGAAGHP
jgi:hypothetical protein